MNNFKGNVNLIADVAVPTNKLEGAINKKLSENQLEDLFEHQNNYATVLNKTLSVLKEKHNKNKKYPVILPSKTKQNSREAAG